MISQQELMKTLELRGDFIDGVVITGGEPTVYPDLVELAINIKSLGLPIKLDTNGYNPDVLRVLFNRNLVDCIAMDIKTSWIKYKYAVGIDIDHRRLIESIGLINESLIDHEFRTTCVPHIVTEDDVEGISKLVGGSGRYILQQFQPQNTLDPAYREVVPYSQEELINFQRVALKNTGICRLVGL